jgi:hypothetical protein
MHDNSIYCRIMHKGQHVRICCDENRHAFRQQEDAAVAYATAKELLKVNVRSLYTKLVRTRSETQSFFPGRAMANTSFFLTLGAGIESVGRVVSFVVELYEGFVYAVNVRTAGTQREPCVSKECVLFPDCPPDAHKRHT